MSTRLRPVALASSLMLLVGGMVATPTFGWLWLLPDVLAAVAYYFLTRRLTHFRRPELVLAAMWLAAEVLLGTSIALASGPREYLLSVLVVPAVFGSIMFPRRVVVPGVGLTLVVVAAVGLGFDWHAISRTPPILWVPLLTVVVVSMTASALGDLDATTRSSAIVDQLTGVFNRMALIPRAAEIAHQAAATGSAASVIVCDVDNFKAINDELGHNAGDTVLKEVARRLGACLGAFEPIYRFGGEEFVIVVAGSELVPSMEIAETLRQAVSAAPILGSTVTMSFGVAASDPGRPFDFEEVFTRADGALYAAKRGGRNRVSIGVSQPPRANADRRAQERRRRRGLKLQTEGRGALIQLATRTEATPEDWRARMEREREATGNWLVRDQLEREHMLDLNRLLGRNFRRTAAAAFLALLAAAPWFGWLMLVPPVIGGVVYNLIQIRLNRVARPEFALAGAWLAMQAGTAGGFMLAQHSPLFALPLFLLLVIGSAAVFPRRAVIVGIAVTGVLLLGAAYEMGGHRLLSTPAIVIFPLVLLGIIGLTGSALGRSAIHYRGAAVVDGLTGMLNRAALSVRAAELAHQTMQTGERVSVILADLDRFQAINDRHGHQRGDAVLCEVAYRIRKHLRAFESMYRFGGEEFAILLTGCDSVDATRVAERLWNAVHSEPVDGLTVTMSCGVATTLPGEAFDYQALFARADAALYAAKHSGRNCIRLDAAPARSLAA